MPHSDLDTVRASSLATLDDIAWGEREFTRANGIDIRDDDEWQQLKDIVARIERKLAAAQDTAA